MNSLYAILSIFFLSTGFCTAQGILKATGVHTDFFSSAPIEDISAKADDGLSLWNTRTGEITFRVNIRSFQFEKGKMQEHFNENFMESHKYPHAIFRGKVQRQPDLTRQGQQNIVITGVLEIHGVKKNREINATVYVRENKIELQSEFDVAVADHDIKIPKILWKNIAEKVDVNVLANYQKLDL